MACLDGIGRAGLTFRERSIFRTALKGSPLQRTKSTWSKQYVRPVEQVIDGFLSYTELDRSPQGGSGLPMPSLPFLPMSEAKC